MCSYRPIRFQECLSLRPPYLGGFQEHNKRGVFQTMSCFSSGTCVCLGHCIIFCSLGSPPGMADPTFLKLNWSIYTIYINILTGKNTYGMKKRINKRKRKEMEEKPKMYAYDLLKMKTYKQEAKEQSTKSTLHNTTNENLH